MADVIARLLTEYPEEESSSVLEAFLAERHRKFVNDYGRDEGNAEFAAFRAEVLGFGEWIEGLLSASKASGSTAGSSQLVLGRVQSGKTSHFTAALAWAIDRGVKAAVVVTGVTEPLWRQSRERLEKDLTGLRTYPPVLIFQTPTASSLRGQDASLVSDFTEAVRRRAEDGPLAPLPILVSMKNKFRLQAARVLLSRALADCEDGDYLLIDDEADQASPNVEGKSEGGSATLSPVHLSLTNLRTGIAPHVLLSYTATPQAIFLANPDNALAPDFLHVVPSGRAYFGLGHLLNERRDGVHVVDDSRSFQRRQRPTTLDDALARFLVAGAIRLHWPEVFFSKAEPGVDVTDRPRYVTFLLHPSGQRAPHVLAARMASDFIKDLTDAARQDPASVVDGLLRPAYRDWLAALPVASRPEIPVEDAEETTQLLYSILKELRLGLLKGRIVNSGKAVAAYGYRLPEREEEWKTASYWILVGGDILGRGITLNNLVGTYFLRNPKSPNMDTAVQQMRFCGYRRDYADMIDVWIPQEVLELYEDVDAIDTVAWARAERLSRDKRLLKGGLTVAYVAPAGHRMSPTRKGAISKDIVDYEYGESVFQTRQIGGPRRTVRNVRYLVEQLRRIDALSWETDADQWASGDIDRDIASLLLGGLTCGSSDSLRRRQILDLFDPALGDRFSLAHKAMILHVRQPDLLSQPPDAWEPDGEGASSPIAGRAASDPSALPASADVWRDASRRFSGHVLEPEVPFERVSINEFIGGEHRRLQKRQPGTVGVFIEPIGIGATGRGGPKSRKAAGVAVGVLAPEGYAVRLMGHRKAVISSLGEH